MPKELDDPRRPSRLAKRRHVCARRPSSGLSTSCWSSPRSRPTPATWRGLCARDALPAAPGRQARLSHRRARGPARRARLLAPGRGPKHADLDAALDDIATTRALPRDARRASGCSAATRTRSYLDVRFAARRRADLRQRERRACRATLLRRARTQVVGIPMSAPVRSHNLANSVAIALYEALRQNRRARLRTARVNAIHSRRRRAAWRC